MQKLNEKAAGQLEIPLGSYHASVPKYTLNINDMNEGRFNNNPVSQGVVLTWQHLHCWKTSR